VATIRHRWLGSDLKRLRETAGLTVQQAATRINVSTSTIQRIERAAYLPKERVLRSLLELYGADSARSAIITKLWHEAKSRGWWIA
jgi:transcriptional regulator with XRE-family HTH domain